MLIALSNEQKAFFEKEKYVEVEEFFTSSELNIIKSHLQQNVSTSSWDRVIYSAEVFQNGHNLLLKNAKLKEAFSFAKIGTLASQLLDFHPLRYVFDQLHTSETLVRDLPISDECSVRGISLVCLLSLATGRCIFIRADRTFPKVEGQGVFWAIGLGGRNLQYVFNEKDPHMHDLKKSGYVFGDALKQTTHPVVFS